MPPLTCHRVTTRLVPYLEGTLSASEEAACDVHLDQCEGCTAKLNDILESDARWQLLSGEQMQMRRQLRSVYTLSEEKEQKGVEKVMATAQTVGLGTPRLAWAAADTSELDETRERLGAVFAQRGPISLPPYTAELYVRDRHSALLAFSKDGQPTPELDGTTIELYVVDVADGEATTSGPVSQTIDAGVAVIDFALLHVPIEDYAKVGLRLYIDASRLIEGRL